MDTHAPFAPSDPAVLLAVLAYRVGLIDQAQLQVARAQWSPEAGSLADWLVGRGWINDDDRRALEALLARRALRQPDSPHHVATVDAIALLSTVDEHLLPEQKSGQGLPTTGYDGGAVAQPEPLRPAGPRYERTRLHATGGLGAVWLARDHELHRDVALKELRTDRRGLPQVRTRFVQEARITGQLEHPGIVPVYELARRENDDQPFYTMRFVHGRTFSEAIDEYHQRRREGSADALALRGLLDAFVGVCNTVAYAHARGVIHRDLKPNNVVLGDFGEVIVLDWGLAKRVGEAEAAAAPRADEPQTEGGTLAGQVLGTPAYMSPEQAEGRHEQIGPASDQYSLGVILYECLTGRVPYQEKDAASLLMRVVEGKPPAPRQVCPGLPVPLEAICLKALAAQPEQRYPEVAELAREVKRWLADEPVQAYPEPLSRRAARWARRHQPVVASAAGVILTVAVALGVGLFAVGREQQRTEQERQAAVDAREESDRNAEAARKAQRLAERNATTARTAEQAALKAQGQADEHARVAGTQRHLALEALQVLAGEVQDRQGDSPDMFELREKLLASALGGLDRVARGAEDPSRADLQAAEAHLRMGELYLLLAQTEKARTQFEATRAIAERVRKTEPNNRRARVLLAASWARLGDVLTRGGKMAQTLDLLVDARTLLLALQGEKAEAEVEHDLSRVACDLGDLTLNLGQSSEARDHYNEGLKFARTQLARQRDSQQGRLDEAQARVRLARVEMEQGHIKEALDQAQRGLDGIAALLKEGNKRPDVRQAQAIGLRARAELNRMRGRLPQARADYEESLQLYERLAAADPRNVSLQLWLSVALNQFGDLLLLNSDLRKAQPLFERSVAIMQKLVEQEGNAQNRRDLALAYLRLSTAQFFAGKLVEAKVTAEKILPLLKAILDADDKHLEAQRDLEGVHTLLGQITTRMNNVATARGHYDKAIELAQGLVKADPRSARFHRDLCLAYNKLGDLLRYQASVEKALDLYRKGQAEADIVLALDRDSEQARQDVALSRLRVAEALHALNQTAAARAEILQSLEILKKLAGDEGNLEFQRDLSLTWQVLGTIEASRGETTAARQAFGEHVKLCEKLVLADPNSARYKRDMLVALNKLGDFLLQTEPPVRAVAEYEKSLRYAQQVYDLDPKQREAQSDLGLGHMRLARALTMSRKPEEAQKHCDRAIELLRPLVADDADDLDAHRNLAYAYQVKGNLHSSRREYGPAREALLISIERSEALARKDEKSPGRNYDLVVCHNQIGDLCVDTLNDLATARRHYERSFAVLEKLADADRERVELQGDLIIGHVRLATVAFQEAQPALARKHLEAALEVAGRLERGRKLDGLANYVPRPPQMRQLLGNLGQVERAIEDGDWAMKQPANRAALLLPHRVKALARQGKHADAAKAADALVALAPRQPEPLYLVGRLYAVCAGGVAPGKKPDQRSKEEAEQHAALVRKSLETLSKAIDAGFKDADRLRLDSDLEAVRGAEGFGKLVEKISPSP